MDNQNIQDEPNENKEILDESKSAEPDVHQQETVKEERELRPIEAVYDVPVTISAVLGTTKMPVNDLLKLGKGSVIELDRNIGDPIDIYVNNRLIAKGEVVAVDDKLAITLTEVIKILK